MTWRQHDPKTKPANSLLSKESKKEPVGNDTELKAHRACYDCVFLCNEITVEKIILGMALGLKSQKFLLPLTSATSISA